MMEEVILVDTEDRELGTMEKMAAHEQGLLHRAFSVFIFNRNGELMLQQRARAKYHSGGLWTNTCCSHPRPNEKVESAAHRRLQEEMGFDVELNKAFHFVYKKDLDKNLIEHELDHVFLGIYNDAPSLNLLEAEDWRWSSLEEIQKDLQQQPESYTEWFKICFDEVVLHSQKLVS